MAKPFGHDVSDLDIRNFLLPIALKTCFQPGQPRGFIKRDCPQDRHSRRNTEVKVLFYASDNPAAAVVDAPGRAIRLSEMHKVPQFHLPVMHAMRPYHLVRMTKPVSARVSYHLTPTSSFNDHDGPGLRQSGHLSA